MNEHFHREYEVTGLRPLFRRDYEMLDWIRKALLDDPAEVDEELAYAVMADEDKAAAVLGIARIMESTA